MKIYDTLTPCANKHGYASACTHAILMDSIGMCALVGIRTCMIRPSQLPPTSVMPEKLDYNIDPVLTHVDFDV